jgi:hypothetical protein
VVPRQQSLASYVWPIRTIGIASGELFAFPAREAVMRALLSITLCFYLFGPDCSVPGALLFAAPIPVALQTEAWSKLSVRVAMKNIVYHFNDNIAVHIVSLQGILIPTRPPEIVVFDDKTSFLLNLTYAEIAMSCDSLAQALNERVFAAADAPIKNLSIQSRGSNLIVKGRLHHKGNVAFETLGILSATADGRVRLHAEKVKAAHLPVKGLMDLLGIEFADVINARKVQGVAFEKDDLLLDPAKILPPPRIEGKVTAVRIQGNEIVQIFGTEPPVNFAGAIRGNYMAYRDNELRFGKLTMHDTDIVLIDMDPQDPFDFYLDHYKDQLVAGYSKTTPSSGLRVYMRDYNKLKRGPGPTTGRN